MRLRKSLAETKPEWLRKHEEARESMPRAGTWTELKDTPRRVRAMSFISAEHSYS